MSKYFGNHCEFDLSKEDNDKAPKNPCDFIFWFVSNQFPTFYSKDGKLHCRRFARRSIDDTYHLVNKRWPMSEIEFLDLVFSVAHGNHTHTKPGVKTRFIMFTFCMGINRIVMRSYTLPPIKAAIVLQWCNPRYWTRCPSFNNPRVFSPLLREYLLNNL